MKLIALDMDGTLLNEHHEISDYTRDVLIDLQKKGVSVVLSSGRDYQSLSHYGKILHMDEFPQSAYICLNGLMICDYQGNILSEEKRLSYQDSLKMEELAIEYDFDMMFFFGKGVYIVEHHDIDEIEDFFRNFTNQVVKHVKDIPMEYFGDLRKIGLMQKTEHVSKILPELHQKTEGLFDVTRVESNWLEVNPCRIHKGYALKHLAEMKNIHLEETMAFGNGENDITMLKAAGKGIAMGNAFDSVKEAADDVCGSCYEDGIGYYLKEMLG